MKVRLKKECIGADTGKWNPAWGGITTITIVGEVFRIPNTHSANGYTEFGIKNLSDFNILDFREYAKLL